jgi:hypothetical protein
MGHRRLQIGYCSPSTAIPTPGTTVGEVSWHVEAGISPQP